MSIRCALCGSNQVAIDTSNEGFNVGKAFAGTILFGAAGAVMGVNGNKRYYYHCAACGTTLSYSMIKDISIDIDKCIADKDNSVYSLRAYKKTYPNIEWSENISELQNDISNSALISTAEDLADLMYNYCTKNSRFYISSKELENNIMRTESAKINLSEINTFSFYEAEEILKKRGLITTAQENDEFFVTVYVNPEEIKANFNDIYIKDTANSIFIKNRAYCLGVLTSIFNGSKTMLMSKAKELLAIEYYKDNVSENPMIVEWLANLTVGQSNNRICTAKGCPKFGILNFLFNKENKELTEIELLNTSFERIDFTNYS